MGLLLSPGPGEGVKDVGQPIKSLDRAFSCSREAHLLRGKKLKKKVGFFKSIH